MTLTQIEYFVEVARTMSYSKAAETLFVSRQTLGKQVQALERELNLELFDRNNKRDLQLTESGKVLFGVWSDMVQKTQDAIWVAREKNNAEKTIIRVGVHEMPILVEYSSKLMKYYRADNSQAVFVNEAAGMGLLEEKLKQNMIDLLIMLSSELNGMGKVNYCVLDHLKIKPCFVMSRSHPLATRKQIHWKDLENQTLLAYTQSFSRDANKTLRDNLQKRNIKPASVIFYENMLSLEMALALGEGIAIIFEISVHDSKQLKFYPIEDENNEEIDIVVCWNQNKNEKIARELAKRAKK